MFVYNWLGNNSWVSELWFLWLQSISQAALELLTKAHNLHFPSTQQNATACYTRLSLDNSTWKSQSNYNKSVDYDYKLWITKLKISSVFILFFCFFKCIESLHLASYLNVCTVIVYTAAIKTQKQLNDKVKKRQLTCRKAVIICLHLFLFL